MAHTPLVESSSRLRDLVVRVMLQACEDLEPEGGQEEEMRYTQSPSWSRPVPRADAAQALPLLLRRVTSSSSRREILDAMRRVAADASPIVRHHFSLTLRYAGRRDEDHVLEIVEGMLTTEQQAPVVIDCLVCLARQVVNDEDARIDLVLLAWDRAPTLLGRDGADDVRENCAKICLERYLRKDDAVGRDLLATIASDPVTYHAEVGALAGALRDELAVDQDEPDGGAPPPPERRARAVKFFTRLCSEFQAACKSWLATPIAERDQSKAEHLVRGVDHLAHEILFASEQSDEAKRSATSPKFLYDLTPAIEHVADVGIVPASFTLLKTLRFFRAIAPAATLRLASRAVVSARASGLGVESLAADEAVKLIEELLAENRDIFRGRGAPARRARNEVADLLDVFVEYGWPRAMTLASRLHEVFS